MANDSWDETAGRFVLPAEATWIMAVYDHGTGAQIANVVRLAGETDAEAGEAWRQECEAAWGHPVTLILASDNEDHIEAAHVSALLGLAYHP